MGLALYALTISLCYALLWGANSGLANRFLILFVALLIVPLEVARRWHRR